MLNHKAGSKQVPGWIRSVILTSLVLFSIFGIWQAFVVPPCGRIIHAAAECPVGSTATFPNTLGLAGGTLFTMTISGVPTVSGTYTIPDSGGNDTFGLLGVAGTWTADQTLNDNINLTFGTGNDATIDYDGTNLLIDPQVVGSGNVLINAGSVDLNNQGGVLNAGAADNDWTQNALTLSGGSSGQVITAQTTGNTSHARLDLVKGTDTTGAQGSYLAIRYKEGAGDGTTDNMQYEIGYNPFVNYFKLGSFNTDGSQTVADVWRVLDGTDDLIIISGNVVIGTTSLPSTGTQGLAFGDGVALSGMASNTAGLYADDVAGTVEVFAIDEAGNSTQISPHPSAFLNTLALGCDLPWAFQSSNPYVGKKISVDLCGAIQALELLTGQTFITISDLPPEELRDWAADQQTNFDKCVAGGGEDGVECVKEQPPQWMADRGVQALE